MFSFSLHIIYITLWRRRPSRLYWHAALVRSTLYITRLLRNLRNDHRFLLRFVESSMQDCGTCGPHFERQTQSDCDDTEQRRYTKTRIQTSRFLTYKIIRILYHLSNEILFSTIVFVRFVMMLQLNPQHTIPTIVDNGFVLSERWVNMIPIFVINYNYNYYNIIYSN